MAYIRKNKVSDRIIRTKNNDIYIHDNIIMHPILFYAILKLMNYSTETPTQLDGKQGIFEHMNNMYFHRKKERG